MRKRMLLLYFIIIVLFLGTFCNLYNIVDGRELAAYAPLYGSRGLRVEINGTRGTIYDRNMTPLVGDNYTSAALVDPLSLDEQSRMQLYSYGQESAESLQEKIQTGRPFKVSLRQAISGSGITSLQEITRYSDHNPAQNVIGYIDADGHGVSGIEALFDDYLYSDQTGYSAVFSVDGVRRALSGMGLSFEGSPSYPKYGVALTLDEEIQKIAEQAADELIDSGAVLVQEVETADIVAMVSRPTYDPYNIAAYLEDENGAMLNKAFASFSSGSSFKIVVTAAALEAGLEFEDEYVCTGFYDAGSNMISCGETEGHGKITLEQAFANSCNTYFCSLAQQVGPERILAMAKKFGFGTAACLWDGYETETGNLPELRDLSAPAALANFAIGQGVLQVTPVQIMNMASIIANDGVLISPRLIHGFADENGEVEPADSMGRDVRVLSRSTARKIREYMCETTKSGTGVLASPILYGAGVKTSSAQTGIVKDGKNILHTWVTGFFPADNPQYVICVLVEGGTSGYRSAAPVFQRIADKMIAAGYVNGAVSGSGARK